MYTQILVPVDGSMTSRRGLREAIALAGLTGGRLRLMHVVDDLSLALSVDAMAAYAVDWMGSLRDAGNCLLAEALAEARAAGVAADTVLRDNLDSTVTEHIVTEALAWPADLIVLGTHGRRGLGRMMLGSGAESVLRRSPVPVLLVRAHEGLEARDAGKASASGRASVAALAQAPDGAAAAPRPTLHVRLPSAALSLE